MTVHFPRFAAAPAAAVLLATTLAAQATAQSAGGDATQTPTADTTALPTDTAVTIGTLPNGLRYYIRYNKKPAHRAEFRLLVKAGSLMEEDDQRGGAHFVEHMAFRGTNHFQGTQIVEYLKSIGVAFGADLNAATSFDNTVYILPVPTDTLAQVKQALQILEDWAHGVTFPQKDMDEERGIIQGERRQNLGAQQRMIEKGIAVLFKGSRYPERMPIGLEATVQNMTRDRLVQFYRQWYRPDRMAIVAVGDFDKAQMEQMIRDQFSKIPAPTTPTPEPEYPLPHRTETAIATMSDAELPGTQVLTWQRAPYLVGRTLAERRESVRRDLADAMLNARFAEMQQKPDAPFLGAGGGDMPLESGIGGFGLMGMVSDTGVERGLEALLTEQTRAARYGFTEGELERARQNVLSGLEQFYQNRNDRQSGEFVGEYVSNFLEGAAIPGADTSVALSRRMIREVTLAEVNARAKAWDGAGDRVVLLAQPQRPGVTPVDTAALRRIINNQRQSVAAYKDEAVTGPLLERAPTPGKVVAETKYADVGVTEWTLSNGARVLLKPTTFKADEILFQGSSKGGTSVIPDDAYPTAAFMGLAGAAYGAGRFTPEQLGKWLSGKIADVGLGVGSTGESLFGSTNRRDLETMLQVAYLKLTAPHYDSAAAVAAIQRTRASLASRTLDPGSVLGDTMTVTLTNHSKRSPIPTPVLLDQVDPKRAFEMFTSRFADAGDFTFLFVGSFNPDTLKPLVERYLASLPSKHTKEEAQDRPEFHPPAGVIHKVVRAGQDPKTTTILEFTGPYQSSARRDVEMDVMTEVLKNRLQNRLREQLAGTYGVGVGAGRTEAPVNTYDITIQFVADPSRRDEMVKETFAEIDALKRTPPSAEEMQKAVAPMVRGRERGRETNEYWTGVLGQYQLGRPFGELLSDAPWRSVTPAQVQAAAREYLDASRYLEFTLLPVQGNDGAPKASAK